MLGMLRRSIAGVALLTLILIVPAAAEEHISIAGLRVAVWSPPAGGEAKAPVVIFSHGFHGCATQSRFLTEALAQAGYLVFAPNHRDATCDGGTARWRDKPEESFVNLQAWSDAVYRDRAEDIHRLIAALEADDRWSARADWDRLGLAGHSLGGYTVLGLAGAWPSWRLAGVKAVLELSPYDQPFIAKKTLGGLAAPVMYQGGTRDLGITPSVAKPGGGYDQSPAPKYFVEFDRAGHLAWSDFPSEAHADIVAYARAFLDRYVKGAPAEAALTRKHPGVVELRYAEPARQ
jgi:predicted dienelactone hydrolase